jgi:hypothetical protein
LTFVHWESTFQACFIGREFVIAKLILWHGDAGQNRFKVKERKEKSKKNKLKKEKKKLKKRRTSVEKVCNFVIFIQFIKNRLTFRKIKYKY